MTSSWLSDLRKIRFPAWFDLILVGYRRKKLNDKRCFENIDNVRTKLLLDVSVISKHDAGTGIQRVVRGIFQQLLLNQPEGFVVCPVAASRNDPYHYIEWQGLGSELSGSEVSVKPGDIFFGLDFSTHAIFEHRKQLEQWKIKGIRFFFLVHDLLPDAHPEWFSVGSVLSYRKWIKQVAILSDVIFCNSKDTKKCLLSHFQDRYGLTDQDVEMRVLPMGWDIRSSNLSTGLPDGFSEILEKCRKEKTVLMVGTIEPRKGHAQVLSAIEHLWESGKSLNFVIVGRPGWKTELLQQSIRIHPELGNRLFWLDNASDEALLYLYDLCHGVIVGSLAEGYGLPLIEALGHGKPVLARDLPVFHEFAHTGVDFFPGKSVDELAKSIDVWLNKLDNFSTSGEVSVSPPSWNETYLELISTLQKNNHEHEILEL